MKHVYVLADQFATAISDHTYAVIEAAQVYGMPIHVLVFGQVDHIALSRLQRCTVIDKIIHFTASIFHDKMPEYVAPMCCDWVQQSPGHVLMAANTYGKNHLPRIAALLGYDMVSNVRVLAQSMIEHDIYAGNIIERLALKTMPICISIQPAAFASAICADAGEVEITVVSTEPSDIPDITAAIVEVAHCDSAKPRLDNATCVIGGGRALGSAASFERLEVVANHIGAAMGGTRAAVDAGYLANHYQIGQTGQVIAPDVYIAFGISGAIQHVTGITASKTIIAINTDPDAEIFHIADYGLVGDWSKVLTAIEQHIQTA